MFRKGDSELADVVERTFRRLATNHDLVPLYRKWLVDRLPTGERLDVPMSAELAHLFRMLDENSADRN
jgi:glutamate/aspartate transport system substrate-binding protein